MSDQGHNISVSVLGKPYQIKCPVGVDQDLQNAAVFLDEKMREVRDVGKVIGTDRVAILTALNIAFDYLNLQKKENKTIDEMAERICNMQKKINEVLTQYEQIEL